MRRIPALTLCLMALGGCQPSSAPSTPAATGDAPAAKTAPSVASAQAKAAPTPAAAPAAEANFELRVIPGAATAGQPGESVVEITPKPGFKMNLDFPARLKLTEHPGLKPAKAQLGTDDADLTEKALKFKVTHTCDAAGSFKVDGLADFSVCNDKACKLIRGEKVAWTVDVK